MPPSTRRTTKLRVALALLLAFVLPSLVLGQIFYWTSPEIGPKAPGTAALYAWPMLVFGLFFGWPYVLGAVGCWAVLDHFDRHVLWTAAIIGLGTGAAVSGKGSTANFHIDIAIAMTLGLVTALGVWWIAYGRQDRLPAPKPLPKPRLAL